jgi:hypothetical protein
MYRGASIHDKRELSREIFIFTWEHIATLAFSQLLHNKRLDPELRANCQGNFGLGSGVICAIRAIPGAVIPAKAGIHWASHWKCAADGVDSRLRGNDKCFEGDPIANDPTTTYYDALTLLRSAN